MSHAKGGNDVRKLGRIFRETFDLPGSQAGNVFIIFALVFPLIAILAAGTVQLLMLYTDQSRTQDVADATALMTAQQIGSTPTGAGDRAQAYALAQLSDMQERAAVTVAVTQPTQNTVQVDIDTHRASFFGNLLPMAEFDTHASATAKPLGLMPLCVLIFGDAKNNNVHLQDQSVMQAPACLVHSNQDVQVDPSAALDAAITQASGRAMGPISPAAEIGAPQVSDPFAQVDITFPSECSTAPVGPGPGGPPGPGLASTLVIDGSKLGGNPYALAPGVYCQNIDIKNGANVQLSAGEYYLAGDLVVEDTSTIVGTDVAIQFAKNASFDFMGSSTVSLSGRKSGKYAGFVILTTRDNQANFTIESNHVTNLLGTIYVPNAQLQVYGTSQVAQASAWTVIAAMSLVVQAAPPSLPIPPILGGGPPQPPGPGGRSSPLLVINANYGASDVPVPTGVGNRGQSSTLVR